MDLDPVRIVTAGWRIAGGTRKGARIVHAASEIGVKRTLCGRPLPGAAIFDAFKWTQVTCDTCRTAARTGGIDVDAGRRLQPRSDSSE